MNFEYAFICWNAKRSITMWYHFWQIPQGYNTQFKSLFSNLWDTEMFYIYKAIDRTRFQSGLRRKSLTWRFGMDIWWMFFRWRWLCLAFVNVYVSAIEEVWTFGNSFIPELSITLSVYKWVLSVNISASNCEALFTSSKVTIWVIYIRFNVRVEDWFHSSRNSLFCG